MRNDWNPNLHLVSKDEPPPMVVSPGVVLYNQKHKEPEWLIEGLIPRGGSTFCLNGRGGIKKSWTFTSMGLSVSLGKPFMGKFKCPRYTSVGNSVLYIQLEETDEEAGHKFQWLANGMNLHPMEIQDAPFYYVVNQPFRIDNPARIDQLKFIIEETCPELVLWDNARKMKLGNVNDSEWADTIAYTLKDLQSVYPSSHGLIHHWRKKSGEKALNDPSEMGSGTATLRDAMSIWLPCEEAESGEFITMHHDKMRRGKKVGSFNYRVRIVDSEGLAFVEYEGKVTGKTEEEGSVTEAIVEILETDPHVAWRQTEIVARLSGRFTERQVKYGARQLELARRVIVQPSKGGRPTLITLRTDSSVDQSILETGQPDTTGQNRVWSGNPLADSDLE